ncbi:hypothetical protein ABEB36_000936 [Hypothenemus hampei]|uniref:Uncharacterized protein n=1 Tax=Hypothenemus hampei TaxID=57062 RepID=A0ABD1FGH4_HYPHA
MWWMMFKCFVLAITVTMFASNVYVCNAEPSPGNNEMYRELMKLDQLYSSIARPRFGKRGKGQEISSTGTEAFDSNGRSQTNEDGYDLDWWPLRR